MVQEERKEEKTFTERHIYQAITRTYKTCIATIACEYGTRGEKRTGEKWRREKVKKRNLYKPLALGGDSRDGCWYLNAAAEGRSGGGRLTLTVVYVYVCVCV